MFTQRFDELFRTMEITSNSEFAVYAGCDRSYISRIRSGSRVIMPESRAAKRLVKSIYTCAVEKEALGRVCALIECDSALSHYEIQNALAAWLFEGDGYAKRQGTGKPVDKPSYGSFATRLSDVMNLAELSNVRLARLSNVDASVISRYRRGMRSPAANSYILESICRTLMSRVKAQGRLDDLCELTGISRSMLINEEISVDVLRGWLCDTGADDTVIIGSLLENIDKFVPDLPSGCGAPEELLAGVDTGDDTVYYYGSDGLRNAAMRLVTTALKNGVRELWLYTEQSFARFNTEEVASRWLTLMGECVKSGIKIKIIHNIDKNLEEMVFSIENWLPFYVSGMIESYYSTKSAGERFTHMMFLAPNVACVSACNTTGGTGAARYTFETDPNELRFLYEQYETLLKDCRTLISLEHGTRGAGVQSRETGGICTVQNSLTLGTMPEELLNRILSRVQLPNGQEDELRAEWRQQREFYAANMDSAFIKECLQIPSPDATDRMPVDTSAALIMYTPDEFREHIANIVKTLASHPNYELYALDEIPFRHIKVVVSSRTATIRRTDIASNELSVSHPLMRLAFVSYAEQLRALCVLDREQTVQKLREYLK